MCVCLSACVPASMRSAPVALWDGGIRTQSRSEGHTFYINSHHQTLLMQECVCVCVFVWVGSVDPKTEYIWSCGHIAEPGARAPIHLPFPLSVFLPHICLHMQDCLWNACCFHAVNQIPHEACSECVKHISGDAVWNGNVTFERAGLREL